VPEQTEQENITSLVKAIHEDRQAAKDKERREAWTKYVSLMVVALAVITAYGSLKAGGYSGRVLLSQAKASDAWAFFQAKSIKRSLAEMELRVGTSDSQPAAAQRVERVQQEQDEIQKQARDY